MNFQIKSVSNTIIVVYFDDEGDCNGNNYDIVLYDASLKEIKRWTNNKQLQDITIDVTNLVTQGITYYLGIDAYCNISVPYPTKIVIPSETNPVSGTTISQGGYEDVSIDILDLGTTYFTLLIQFNLYNQPYDIVHVFIDGVEKTKLNLVNGGWSEGKNIFTVKFDSLAPNKTYDVILRSELNYFDPESAEIHVTTLSQTVINNPDNGSATNSKITLFYRLNELTLDIKLKGDGNIKSFDIYEDDKLLNTVINPYQGSINLPKYGTKYKFVIEDTYNPDNSITFFVITKSIDINVDYTLNNLDLNLKVNASSIITGFNIYVNDTLVKTVQNPFTGTINLDNYNTKYVVKIADSNNLDNNKIITVTTPEKKETSNQINDIISKYGVYIAGGLLGLILIERR